jgi:two-component system chemotaxis sensor kinase CheA
MLKRLANYMVLPDEITPFESSYLAKLNRVALYFFLAHLPVFVAIAAYNGTGPLRAGVLTGIMLVGPGLAYRTIRNPRFMAAVSGVTAMCMGGLLVHFGRGAMQIEMHFYFFVLLALLAVFANPVAIVAAAVTVVLHHLILFFVLPRSVFNYDAEIWAVAVHGIFVALESVAACFVARSFFDNVIGLERIVERRTNELDGRNRALRLVLDNVDQGLLTLTLDGRPDRERSAVIDRWLAGLDEGPVWEAFARQDAAVGAWFEDGWWMVQEGTLPLEVALDQLPKRLTQGERTLALDYKPVADASGAASKVLLMITDITAEVARERAEAEQRDFHRVFDHLMRDRQGFLDFFREADRHVVAIQDGALAPVVVKRTIHTLKGNAGTFGLSRIASLCHAIETTMQETGEPPSAAERGRIAEEWSRIAAKLETVIGEHAPTVEVDTLEIDRVAADLRAGGGTVHSIAERLLGWKLEPAERRLARLGRQAQALAERAGKAVEISVDAPDLRLSPVAWREFWAASGHAIRNTVDHGIESPDERAALGKPRAGQLRLSALRRADRLVIEITDDGRGVDWDTVRIKARAAGLAAESSADLVAALFHDGITTRTTATETSGRGVGMGALRAASQRTGGDLEVHSTPGRGTTLRITWPWEPVARAGGALLAAPPTSRAA